MKERSGKQELAVQLAKSALADWREAHDALPGHRENVRLALQRAVEAGVSQADLARELDWPRQRVSLVLKDQG